MREMVSAFWEIAYKLCCDGDSLLVPLLHPGSNADMFTKLGRILSHGYMQCGFLPLKIAFPTMLLGVGICINFLVLRLLIASMVTNKSFLNKASIRRSFHVIFKQNWLQLLATLEEESYQLLTILKILCCSWQNIKFKSSLCQQKLIFNASFGTLKTLADIYLLYMSMVATPAKII